MIKFEIMPLFVDRLKDVSSVTLKRVILVLLSVYAFVIVIKISEPLLFFICYDLFILFNAASLLNQISFQISDTYVVPIPRNLNNGWLLFKILNFRYHRVVELEAEERFRLNLLNELLIV